MFVCSNPGMDPDIDIFKGIQFMFRINFKVFFGGGGIIGKYII